MTRLILALLLLCLPATAWSQRGPLVLAAASLRESMTAAADAWAKGGHARPVLSFASSAVLARQIMGGAPADLFVSADREWMDMLAAKRLIRPASRADLVANRLVLVAARGDARRYTLARGPAFARQLGDGRLAMGDPASVPAGRYGADALKTLGAWDGVAGRIARGDNVRAALALVARGEAPLGIVYATDALVEPGVRVVATFPANSHAPIVYPLATVMAATSPEAEGFRRFLLSSRGGAIFARFGFASRRR